MFLICHGADCTIVCSSGETSFQVRNGFRKGLADGDSDAANGIYYLSCQWRTATMLHSLSCLARARSQHHRG